MMRDRPFGVPPDIEFHAPIPPSTNRVRRVDWSARPMVKKWLEQTDKLFLLSKRKNGRQSIPGRYQIKIVLNEKCRVDPSNTLKILEDTAKRYGLIVDDSPKFCRRIIIEFGDAPEGARVILTPME